MYFSINYILSIITPIKQVWNGGGKKTDLSLRNMVKATEQIKKVS